MCCLSPPLFKRSPWLGPVLAAGAALLLFCLGVLFPSAWMSAGVYHVRPYFSDLFAVLAANDAVAAGADPFAVPNPFDVIGRPHVYGPAWLSLHYLGLTRDHASWLGSLLLLGTVMVGAVWLAPRTWTDTLLAAAWLASPPFLLAYERGNNDLVMLLLLSLIGLTGKPASRLGGILAGAALLAASLLKFYPVAGVGALLATGSRRTCMRRLLLWGGVAGLFVFLQWPLFASALRVTPGWATVYGFGLPVVAQFFKLLPDSLPWFFSGAILALVVLGLVWRQTPFREWIVVLRGDPVAAQWLAAAGGAWIACFVVLGILPVPGGAVVASGGGVAAGRPGHGGYGALGPALGVAGGGDGLAALPVLQRVDFARTWAPPARLCRGGPHAHPRHRSDSFYRWPYPRLAARPLEPGR
jgi:hypothetical protein